MYPTEELLISQRADMAWIVTLPHVSRPWAIERSQDAAITRARQYAPQGTVRLRRPDGNEIQIDLSAPV